VARLRGRLLVTDRVRQMAHMPLLIGPIANSTHPRSGARLRDDPDDEVLRTGWELDREELLSYPHAPGWRAWAFWVFDIEEEPPRGYGADVVRLAEVGLLKPDEVAALEERANEARLRVGTPRERVSGGALGGSGVSVDARAVELWDAVRAASRIAEAVAG
jgi:hypothetical protein